MLVQLENRRQTAFLTCTLHRQAVSSRCSKPRNSKQLLFLSPSLSYADISLVQDDEVGDGTTSVTVLACELLKVQSSTLTIMTFSLTLFLFYHPSPSPYLLPMSQEAERLVNAKIHPQTIIAGWRLATDAARAALTSVARDNSGDPEKFNEVSCVHFLAKSSW